MKIKTTLVLGMTLALASCGGEGSHHADKGAQVVNTVAAEQIGEIEKLQADLAQTAGDRVYFVTGQNNLTAEAKTILSRQASWLAQHPQTNILIAGNCDDRGAQDYNLALGGRRANAARDYLEARGVSSARIRTISYGKERPSVPGNTSEAYAKNRNAITNIR